MDSKVLGKLYKLGAIDKLANGRHGVRVSLMWKTTLPATSRSARRNILQQKFAEVANDIRSDGAEVDPGSVSVSGQTVEAIFPVDNYDYITDKLKKQDIRVDLLTSEQVLLDKLDQQAQ
jgi:hypothetical protein